MSNHPVVIGLGQAVHVANGSGTLCRPSAEAVAITPTEQVTCKRCLAKSAARPATETPAAPASLTEGKTACACGCELPTGGRYRPGHDARHAGWLARQVIQGAMDYNDAMDAVATDALRRKIDRQVARAA